MMGHTVEELGLAIVEQALNDLIKAYKHGGCFIDCNTSYMKVTAEECEEFLREQEFTETDGETLILMCKRKAGII